MNLDPTLSGRDRWGNLAIGLGFVAYAFLGDFDNTWVRALMAAGGAVFAIGGIGGT